MYADFPSDEMCYEVGKIGEVEKLGNRKQCCLTRLPFLRFKELEITKHYAKSSFADMIQQQYVLMMMLNGERQCT